MKTTIKLKPDAIVVMIGAIGTGKSTFTETHFSPYHIVESDFIREQLTGNSENMDYNGATFEIFFATLTARAKAGILTVLDSTGNNSVVNEAERIAKKHNRQLVAIKLPHLKDEEITPERMKHRMKFIDVYHRMVTRIDAQVIPDSYELYEPDDINDVVVDIEAERDKYTLDPQFKYIVIPDLHGEYRVLEEYVRRYPEDNTKFIFLGDIVDRGESSFKTFRLVDKLIKCGKGFGVISNHDNKLMRYFQKWLRDENPDKYFVQSFIDGYRNYNMSIAHGLEKTLLEFFDLHMHFMDGYAEDFISYYEGLADYLYLEKDKTHFFAHAGVTGDIIRGMPVEKRSLSALLYETTTVDNVDDVFRGTSNTTLHLGHDFLYEMITEYVTHDGNSLIKHDIGLGKRDLKGYVPEFYVIKL